MSGDLVIQMAQQALMIVLIVAAPMLGLGLIVGLMVSVFQATTSIQDGLHTEDHSGVCGHSHLWPLDAAHYGGICDECVCEPAVLYRLKA